MGLPERKTCVALLFPVAYGWKNMVQRIHRFGLACSGWERGQVVDKSKIQFPGHHPVRYHFLRVRPSRTHKDKKTYWDNNHACS
jgi:hypothetical protein